MARIPHLVNVYDRQVVLLRRFPFRIGRDPAADYQLAQLEVSRQHASLTWGLLRGYWIADLGSTNGTLLNRRRLVRPTPVREGDVVTLAVCHSKPAGAVHLYFTFEENHHVHDAVAALRKDLDVDALRDSLLGAEPAFEGEHTTRRLAGRVTVVSFRRPHLQSAEEEEGILRELLVAAAGAPRPWLVVSFQGVEVAPVGLLALLVLVQQELRQQGGDLRVACLGPNLDALFQVGQLDGALSRYPTELEAVRAYQRSELETQY